MCAVTYSVVMMLEQHVAHGFFKINTHFFLFQWCDVEEATPRLRSYVISKILTVQRLKKSGQRGKFRCSMIMSEMTLNWKDEFRDSGYQLESGVS